MNFKLRFFISIQSLLLIIIFTMPLMAAQTISTKGTINENEQFVSQNGDIFDIAESEKGDELRTLNGENVLVSGTFTEDDGTKILTVVTYEIVEEQSTAKVIGIKGTINENEQLVGDDGVVYDIADNEAGGEIVTLAGERVSVKASIIDEDGTKVLTIESFEKIEN